MTINFGVAVGDRYRTVYSRDCTTPAKHGGSSSMFKHRTDPSNPMTSNPTIVCSVKGHSWCGPIVKGH